MFLVSPAGPLVSSTAPMFPVVSQHLPHLVASLRGQPRESSRPHLDLKLMRLLRPEHQAESLSSCRCLTCRKIESQPMVLHMSPGCFATHSTDCVEHSINTAVSMVNSSVKTDELQSPSDSSALPDLLASKSTGSLVGDSPFFDHHSMIALRQIVVDPKSAPTSRCNCPSSLPVCGHPGCDSFSLNLSPPLLQIEFVSQPLALLDLDRHRTSRCTIQLIFVGEPKSAISDLCMLSFAVSLCNRDDIPPSVSRTFSGPMSIDDMANLKMAERSEIRIQHRANITVATLTVSIDRLQHEREPRYHFRYDFSSTDQCAESMDDLEFQPNWRRHMQLAVSQINPIEQTWSARLVPFTASSSYHQEPNSAAPASSSTMNQQPDELPAASAGGIPLELPPNPLGSSVFTCATTPMAAIHLCLSLPNGVAVYAQTWDSSPLSRIDDFVVDAFRTDNSVILEESSSLHPLLDSEVDPASGLFKLSSIGSLV